MVAPLVLAEPAAPPAMLRLNDLPKLMQQRVLDKPEVFARQMAELIIGHGQKGAIDANGVDTYIQLERARVRAYHYRRLQQADLNGDGTITKPELAALQKVVSARQRGILELAHRRADSDVDARVSPVELLAYCQRRAQEELTPDEAAMYRAVLRFDVNASGDVTLDEVIAVVATLRAQASQVNSGADDRRPGKGRRI